MTRLIALMALLFSLSLAACEDKSATSPVNRRWAVQEILGKGVTERGKLTISFDADGRVSGNSGCNLFSGSYKIGDETLSFSPLAMTRRACLNEALNRQEVVFADALARVAIYRIDSGSGLLYLLDADGIKLLLLNEVTEN